MEDTVEVDRHDLAPVGFGHVEEGCGAQDAGVVDEHVDSTQRRAHLGHGVAVGDVSEADAGAAAQRAHQHGGGFGGRCVVVNNADVAPIACQPQCNRAPDAATGAGDESCACCGVDHGCLAPVAAEAEAARPLTWAAPCGPYWQLPESTAQYM